MPADRFRPSPSACSAVFVDHLSARFREPADLVERELVELVADHWADVEAPFDPDEVEFIRSDKAGNFEERRKWTHRGLPLFVVRQGNADTRGWSQLVIEGESCRLVSPEFWGELAGIGERRGWQVSRADLAVDDDSGLLSVAALQEAYDAGLLSHASGGRQRLFAPLNPRRGLVFTGWTVNLGMRASSSVFWRFYDKHAEVKAKRGPDAAALIPVQRVRCEQELKQVKGGPAIPWAVLREPAAYYAADCEIAAQRAFGVEPVRLGRIVRDRAEAELWAALHHCQVSYGAYIEQAFQAYGADELAARVLVDKLRRPGSRPPVPGVCLVAGGGVPDSEFVAE